MSDIIAYEIIIGTEESKNRDRAVALATSRLTYGDDTNTFVFGDLFDVTVYGDNDPNQQMGVGLNVAIEGVDSATMFESQLNTLDIVESWERIHYGCANE